MTRYDLFQQLRELCELKQTGKHSYNKMMQSGELVNTHHDYGRGYYDVSIQYFKDYKDKHQCRIWFGTIDDGDYGSWNECETKEEAVNLVENACDMFQAMTVLPGHEELNEKFRKLGIYFCNQ